MESPGKLTISELREKLKSLGCKSTGTKKTLRDRLKKHYEIHKIQNGRHQDETTPINQNQHEAANQHRISADQQPSQPPIQFTAITKSVDQHPTQSTIQQSSIETHLPVQTTTYDKEMEMAKREIELMKREIEILNREKMILEKEKNSKTENGYDRNVKSSVVELLSYFYGENDNFSIWKSQIDGIRKIYKVTDEEMKIIVVSKLKGRALSWFHSSGEQIYMNLDELLMTLKSIFDNRPNKVQLRKNFEARIWKANEKFTEYYQDKLCMANNLGLTEEEFIDLSIEGIGDNILQNQARIQKFKNKEDFLQSFSAISKEKHPERSTTRIKPKRRCYNCNMIGHLATECNKPKRVFGSCFQCGSTEHLVKNCPQNRKKAVDRNLKENSVVAIEEGFNEFMEKVILFITNGEGKIEEVELSALLDTGSVISLVKEKFVSNYQKDRNFTKFYGINNSELRIFGKFNGWIKIFEELKNITMYVVDNNSMQSDVIIGRDFLKTIGARLEFKSKEIFEIQNIEKEILNICINNNENEIEELKFSDKIPFKVQSQINKMYQNYKREYYATDQPKIKGEIKINLVKDEFISAKPRRLSFVEREALKKILNELLDKKVIRESSSPYCSPIVLINKKNRNEYRLCIDYRNLNKLTLKDNYPLPVIEDLIDKLSHKNYFSLIDLKSGFHHVSVNDDSVKYTSFITPLGQYEYLKMPFGLKNAPSVFQRYVEKIFRPLIENGDVIIYVDDLLISSVDIPDHLRILKSVFKILSENLLEINVQKCRFLSDTIDYLGYNIDGNGIRPNMENIKAIQDYPVPQNLKEVQRFLGMASYFRKFVFNFSHIAKPLYDLTHKGVPFNFKQKELQSFEQLKSKLVERPLLAIYCPTDETELHCDGSSVGYGSILMQRKSDGKLHPVFYFSKRTTPQEAKYHSYEQETLAIIYALRRFRIYLLGKSFKIITDCNALTLTLNKQNINPRISRWVLEMQSFDYKVEHRDGNKMQHVDALSRCQCIFVLEENSFEQIMAICQTQDKTLEDLRKNLEEREHPLFELRNGLIYRKIDKSRIRFYVPEIMEIQVIKNSHDVLGHLGLSKTVEVIKKTYWFPKLKEKVTSYIKNCPKCITFNSNTGKSEGFLHPIPKGEVPFESLHIDYYGPLEPRQGKKYILVVIDGFTKFVKLYATKAPTTNETIRCLESYFNQYSRPVKLITDRGTCFTSVKFKEYCKSINVQHILVASGCPKANGQVERVNRSICPMIAKLIDKENKKYWVDVLNRVEFALNNTYSKSTGTSPSKLLFGVEQRGELNDKIKEYLENFIFDETKEPLESLRAEAAENIKKSQNYNKVYFNKKRKTPHVYSEGDLVMITNVDTTKGSYKKFIPRYKGPYKVIKILGNDRYYLTDVEGFQVTQRPFEGIYDVSRLRPWLGQSA